MEPPMSSVDERSRHQLYGALESLLAHEEVDTLMAMLPPVGWADVATKHDLLALEDRMGLRFDAQETRFATKDDLHSAFRTMLLTMVGLFLTQTSLLLTVLVTAR